MSKIERELKSVRKLNKRLWKTYAKYVWKCIRLKRRIARYDRERNEGETNGNLQQVQD